MKPLTSRLSPAHLTALVAVSLIAFALHNVVWIVHELSGERAWPRGLELTYLITLFIWVPGLLLTLWLRRALGRRWPAVVLQDERSAALFTQAHMVALVIVLLVQLPFFVVTVPSRVLAQITVTTCVIALFGTYAWLDRS